MKKTTTKYINIVKPCPVLIHCMISALVRSIFRTKRKMHSAAVGVFSPRSQKSGAFTCSRFAVGTLRNAALIIYLFVVGGSSECECLSVPPQHRQGTHFVYLREIMPQRPFRNVRCGIPQQRTDRIVLSYYFLSGYIMRLCFSHFSVCDRKKLSLKYWPWPGVEGRSPGPTPDAFMAARLDDQKRVTFPSDCSKDFLFGLLLVFEFASLSLPKFSARV